jgi:hypothetical protein
MLFHAAGSINLYGQLAEPETRTLNFGAMVQSKTIGIDFKLATQKNEKYSTLIDLDFISIKHPKEQRVTNNRYSNGGPFVFGKLNHFHTLRIGYGIKKTLGKRVSRNTVNVSAIGVIGLDVGLLKPVFLEIIQPDSFQELSNVEPFDPSIHNAGNIVGGAGYFYGFDRFQVKPGAYGKVGLEFGWGNYRTSYVVVEVGATLDVFFSNIPIMHIAENKSTFSGFYISFALAKIY